MLYSCQSHTILPNLSAVPCHILVPPSPSYKPTVQLRTEHVQNKIHAVSLAPYPHPPSSLTGGRATAPPPHSGKLRFQHHRQRRCETSTVLRQLQHWQLDSSHSSSPASRGSTELSSSCRRMGGRGPPGWGTPGVSQGDETSRRRIKDEDAEANRRMAR